ncbi:MAG: hypothetical protein EOO86_18710 [Pedobacter sp.]|nr:MAG: hypothetical protein EOO86_18710 [Pedobacter sp.]
MRTGIILSYNRAARYGFVKDINGQKIRFYNEDPLTFFQRLDVVRFRIAFIGSCLRAVNVIHVIDKHGKTISMRTMIN